MWIKYGIKDSLHCKVVTWALDWYSTGNWCGFHHHIPIKQIDASRERNEMRGEKKKNVRIWNDPNRLIEMCLCNVQCALHDGKLVKKEKWNFVWIVFSIFVTCSNRIGKTMCNYFILVCGVCACLILFTQIITTNQVIKYDENYIYFILYFHFRKFYQFDWKICEMPSLATFSSQ